MQRRNGVLVPIVLNSKSPKGAKPLLVIALCVVVSGGILFVGGIVMITIARREMQKAAVAIVEANTAVDVHPDATAGFLFDNDLPGQQLNAPYSPHGPSQSYAPQDSCSKYRPCPQGDNVQPFAPPTETSVLLPVKQPPSYEKMEQ